jgi:hypothetical protein
VDLLRADPGEIAAELAAVVLRNLALGNAANRQAIMEAGGLEPMLHLLSMGQEKLVHPMPCEVTQLFWVGLDFTCLSVALCASRISSGCRADPMQWK